jgi:hypothetical protein
MADENIERIVRYVADTSQAVSQLDKLTAATERNAAQLDNVGGQLESINKKIDISAGFKIAKEIITEVASKIQDVIDGMDQLGKSAAQIGVTVEKVQSLQYALGFAGLKSSETVTALSRLSDKLADIDDRTNKTSRELRSMGVAAGDDAATAVLKIADAFSHMQDGTEKTSDAVDIFGRVLGNKLIPALNGGADAVQGLMNQQESWGKVTDDDARQASDFNDKVRQLEEVTASLGKAIVRELLPPLNAFLKWCLDMVGPIKSAIDWMEKFHLAYGAGNLVAQATRALKGEVPASLQGMVDSVGDFTTAMIAADKATQKAADDARGPKWLRDYGDKAHDAAEAFAQIPQKLALLRAEMAKPEAQGNKLLLQSLTSQAAALEKQLDGATKKAGGGAKVKVPAPTEYERWLKNLDRQAEAADNADLKIAELNKRLAALNDAGQGASVAAKKLQSQLDQLQPPDAVTLAIRKLAEEAKKLDDAPGVIEGLEANLVKLRNAGPGAANAVKLTTDELLKLKAAGTGADAVVASVTIELDKLAKTRAFDDAAQVELWSRFGTAGSNAGDIVQALSGHMKDAGDAIKDTTDKAKDLSETIKEGAASFVTDWVGTMIDGFGKTKASFEDMVTDMIKMIAKLIVQYELANAVKKMGIGVNETGAAFNEQSVQYMAQGGILNGPTFFRTGSQMAVAGEAGPEAVLPLRRTSGGDLGVAASPVNITITNNSPPAVSATSRDNVDGSRTIDILVREKVKGMMTDGTMDRTMRSTYGLARQPAMG